MTSISSRPQCVKGCNYDMCVTGDESCDTKVTHRRVIMVAADDNQHDDLDLSGYVDNMSWK